MDRRRFLLISLAGAFTAPAAGAAQRPDKMYRVGVVWETVPAASQPLFEPLRQALGELGYIEGQSIRFEQRWAGGKRELVPELMAELIRERVDVLALPSNPLIAAGKHATATQPIPIVMSFGADPVAAGFIASLARPGGNITGMSATASPDTLGKLLELLTQVRPETRRVGHLYDPTQPGTSIYITAAVNAAKALNVTIVSFQVHSREEITDVFKTIGQQQIDGLVVLPSPLTVAAGSEIGQAALKLRLPAVVAIQELIRGGFLLAYGPSFVDMTRRAAYYIDRIIKGAAPASLPVEQPTTLRLAINLKTAKALGLTIPPSLLARADHIVE